MKEQFATYEISLAVKELGFDEECLGVYINTNAEPVLRYNWSHLESQEKAKYIYNADCLAPLWQQIIDWFWNNYQILIYPYLIPDKTKRILWITKYQYEHFCSTKEEAILKAIELCQTKK